MSARKAPNEEDKAAIHECGKILGCAIDSRFKAQIGPEYEVIFAGCQGIGPGALPSLPGYAGGAFTVSLAAGRLPGLRLLRAADRDPLLRARCLDQGAPRFGEVGSEAALRVVRSPGRATHWRVWLSALIWPLPASC